MLAAERALDTMAAERKTLMSDHPGISRRSAILAAGSAAAAAMLTGAPARSQTAEKTVIKGRIKQAASKWCYGKIPLDQFCQEGAKFGLMGVDLLGPGDFATLKKYNMVCTMTNTHGLGDGLNRKENHEKYLPMIRKAIDANAEYHFPNVITFPGMRRGMADDEGAKNMIEALKQVAGYAEEKKVTICIELLNSKRDHKDYMADHTLWGVEVCKAVGSERVKLLYDIYHMQIMEGDVIATIRQYGKYFGHIHTGGVPGRNEIDETQELYHPAIMKALLEIKYEGYVAHEFMPKRDPMTSLAAAIKLCDV